MIPMETNDSDLTFPGQLEGLIEVIEVG